MHVIEKTGGSSSGANDELHVVWGDGAETAWLISKLCKVFAPPQSGVKADPADTAPLPWSADTLGGGKNIQEFRFEELIDDDATLLSWLEALSTVGLCLVRGCPVGEDDTALTAISSRAGFMRATNYDEGGGAVFNVISKSDPNNQAYTDGLLPLHTDLAFMKNPPDFQFLVCLKQSSTGGISTFADGIHVASILRQSRPDLYQALVEQRVINKDDEKDWQVSAR
jgi:gamma-butyrobetaine dioxygenase